MITICLIIILQTKFKKYLVCQKESFKKIRYKKNMIKLQIFKQNLIIKQHKEYFSSFKASTPLESRRGKINTIASSSVSTNLIENIFSPLYYNNINNIFSPKYSLINIQSPIDSSLQIQNIFEISNNNSTPTSTLLSNRLQSENNTPKRKINKTNDCQNNKTINNIYSPKYSWNNLQNINSPMYSPLHIQKIFEISNNNPALATDLLSIQENYTPKRKINRINEYRNKRQKVCLANSFETSKTTPMRPKATPVNTFFNYSLKSISILNY